MRQVADDFNLKSSTCFVLRDTQRTVTDAIPMRGKTTASPTLQNDTISSLSMFFQAKAKCFKIETIITEVILVGSDLKGNQAGAEPLPMASSKSDGQPLVAGKACR